uniref:Uncharacterized protein n=1 Tax=viral metagenome TaxID=1070528 RepID=A0A6C0H8T7_9ZZZZ
MANTLETILLNMEIVKELIQESNIFASNFINTMEEQIKNIDYTIIYENPINEILLIELYHYSTANRLLFYVKKILNKIYKILEETTLIINIYNNFLNNNTGLDYLTEILQTHINNGITNEQELLEKTKDITKLIRLFNEINELKIIYIQYSNKAMCILNNHINNLNNIDINIIDQYLSTLPNYNNYVNNYYTINDRNKKLNHLKSEFKICTNEIININNIEKI